MKTGYRVLLLVLAVLLAVSMVGCGGGDEPSSGNQPTSDPVSADWREGLDFGGREFNIVATSDWTPKEGACAGTDKFISHIAECETKYNFKLGYKRVAESSYNDSFTTATLAGEYIGDIWYTWTYLAIPGYAKANLIYSLDDFSVYDFTDAKWCKEVIDFCEYRGKHYGFMTYGTYDCFQETGSGVFFNKALFEREGMESPYDLYRSGNWTWDKMRELALQATKDTDNDGENDQFGITIKADMYPFIYSNGGSCVVRQPDGSYTYGLNSPQSVEAIEFYMDLINSGVSTKWLGDWKSSRLVPFQEGKVAMFVYEWWTAYTYLTTMKDDYGWVPFPIGPSSDGNYHLYRSSTSPLVIPICAQDPEKIMQMYDLITDHEDWSQPDVYRNYIEDRVRDDDTIEIFGDAIRGAWNVYDYTASVSGLQGLISPTMTELWNGNMSVQSGMDAIAAAGQALIDQAFGNPQS